MNELIEKFKSLYNDLVVLQAKLNAQEEENSRVSKELYLDQVSLAEANESLKKREEAVKVIEDVLSLKKQIDHVSENLANDKASFLKEKEANRIEHDFFVTQQSTKIAELDKLKDVFQKKNDILDKKIEEIEEEKKNVRANVLAELKALV